MIKTKSTATPDGDIKTFIDMIATSAEGMQTIIHVIIPIIRSL